MLYCHLSVCPSICLSHAKMSHLTTRCILCRLSATTFVFPTLLTPYLSSVCPFVCLLCCILHPCSVSTENPHLKSATLHGHPFFLPLILHFNSQFCVSRCLLCLISACQDVFFWTNLRVHLTFLPSISSINLLFCVSRRLLCLIFACRLPFLHVTLHAKTSFSGQICTSTSPFYTLFCMSRRLFRDKYAHPPTLFVFSIVLYLAVLCFETTSVFNFYM